MTGFSEIFGMGGRRKREEQELKRKQTVEHMRANENKELRVAVAKEIGADLWRALNNKDKEEQLRFICADSLVQILTLSRIEQLSKGLDWSTPKLQSQARRHFVKVISTLIWIKWDYWEDFRYLFLEHHNDRGRLDRTDEHLPLENTSFLQTEELRTLFRDQQYIFTPVVIMEDDEDDQDYEVQYSEKHRMPFVETEMIGQGGSGMVTKEKIVPGHFLYKKRVLNPEPVVVARKLIPRARTPGSREDVSFLAEQKSLKSFKRCLEGNLNIMLSYTSFAHGPYFTIISPLADLDLHTFFQGTYDDFIYRSHGFTPAHLLYGVSCLAGALRFLHEGLKPVGISGKISCAHLDLKPENILVVWKGKGEPTGRWLLHDFGTSKIKEKSPTRTLAPGDFLRQFSLTQPQRAPGPFQAPEVLRSNERVVGTESDIWSLGCILAVVLSFAIGGPPFVTKLAESRTHLECNDDDYFYFKKDNKITLKEQVVRWLESLNTGGRDNTWVRETRALIYNTLVEKPSARPSAKVVQSNLEAIYHIQTDSLQNICGWVPVELPGSPSENPRPVEPTETSRIPESLAVTGGNVLPRRQEYESGLEVVIPVPSINSSPRTYSAVQFPSSPLQGSEQSGSRSSSVSAIPVSLTQDTTFMRLEVPRDSQRVAICPSACHAAFLSKRQAMIWRLGGEGIWMGHKPPKINADPRARRIDCPDNWEWDFACLAGDYLILRSRKPSGKERRIYRYKCDDGRIWNEEPLIDTGNIPIRVSTALDIVISIQGDVLFIDDTHLWYYCSRHGLLIELFTQGQHRSGSACFSPDGRWVFGWSHLGGYNYFYKWDAWKLVRHSSSVQNRTLQLEWQIPVLYNSPPRLGTGQPAIFPFLDYFVAFDRPDRIYTVGKDPLKPEVVQVPRPFRDIIRGVSIQGVEGPRKVESLVLLQDSRPSFLITLSMSYNGAHSASKLQYQCAAGTYALAVLIIDSKIYVVIMHADGKLERRMISST